MPAEISVFDFGCAGGRGQITKMSVGVPGSVLQQMKTFDAEQNQQENGQKGKKRRFVHDLFPLFDRTQRLQQF